MTDEQINIAIAEWCGWTRNKGNPAYWTGPNRESTMYVSMPNYANDLNAMEQAEEGLHGEEWARYFQRLQLHGRATGVRATAPERAEQLLRTIGKWKE